MIRHLRISNLGLLDNVDLELNGHLVAITGETGAGKTMVLTAIDALLGRKIATSLISESDSTLVEAEIDFSSSDLNYLIEEHQLAIEDGRLIVSRSFSKDSKTRNFLGGRSVPAAIISEVLGDLIFIHGQKDQSRLTRSSYALAALDNLADLAHQDLIKKHADLYRSWKELEEQLAEIDSKTQSQIQDQSRLQQMIDDINEVNPTPNEDLSIEKQLDNLHFQEKIKRALALASELAEGPLLDKLKELDKAFSQINLDQEVFRATNEALHKLIDDFNFFTISASRLTDSYENIGNVEDLENRRFKINRLIKLYGPTLEDVFKNLHEAQIILAKLNDPGKFREQINNQLNTTKIELSQIAKSISNNRKKVAKQIETSVTHELKDLMLPDAEFNVQISEMDLFGKSHNSSGIDNVDFLFRSSKKLPFGPISKIASGGELSRLMLAIEVVMARGKTNNIMVFDEIDAGVGGKAAIEIAKRLKKLAENNQVILVTHLAQVAAFADQHLVVEKNDSKRGISTSVNIVKGETRKLELSRMLAGLEGSESALQHAEELLSLATNQSR